MLSWANKYVKLLFEAKIGGKELWWCYWFLGKRTSPSILESTSECKDLMYNGVEYTAKDLYSIKICLARKKHGKLTHFHLSKGFSIYIALEKVTKFAFVQLVLKGGIVVCVHRL